MTSISIVNAKKNLNTIIDSLHDSHEPLLITGKNNSAVLVSESDWRAIEETLFLTSIPKMREAIIAGMNEPIGNCSAQLEW